MREISYQVRIVVHLPDDFDITREPTNTTLEFVLSEVVFSELLGDEIQHPGISVKVSSERLDK